MQRWQVAAGFGLGQSNPEYLAADASHQVQWRMNHLRKKCGESELIAGVPSESECRLSDEQPHSNSALAN